MPQIKKKYIKYLLVTVAAYLLIGIATIAAPFMYSERRESYATPTSIEEDFQAKRDDISFWAVISFEDFKNQASQAPISDIRIETNDRVSAVSGTGDRKTVLVAEDVPKDQALRELRQFGEISDKSSSGFTFPGSHILLALIPVFVLLSPFMIVWLLYKALISEGKQRNKN